MRSAPLQPSDWVLAEFEWDGSTCLLLADVCSVDRIAIRRHVIDPEGNEVATAQLAVDGEIEKCQVANTALQLQVGSNGPHVAWSQWRLRARELAFVPRLSTCRCSR